MIKTVAVVVGQIRIAASGQLHDSAGAAALCRQIVPLALSIPVHDRDILAALPVVRLAQSPVLIGNWVSTGPFPDTLLRNIVKADPVLFCPVLVYEPLLLGLIIYCNEVTAVQFCCSLRVKPGPVVGKKVHLARFRVHSNGRFRAVHDEVNVVFGDRGGFNNRTADVPADHILETDRKFVNAAAGWQGLRRPGRS